ncbi:GrpB family protein [Alcaligenes sp. WGS1538]|uniref:GrpB family protein n=1 Tax=Alcaligenes sp. WGS1538 TaxID=3366811 RepID=UPI00372D267B
MAEEFPWRHVEGITYFEAGDPDENPWVVDKPTREDIAIEPYDPVWAQRFETLKTQIGAVLGEAALAIEHVGSTAVPGLAAKPVIDIDLIVADPEQEESYVPALAELGYVLTIRERSWYGHRMLRHHAPRVNLHVFGPECPEHVRHLLFRDWLRGHEQDREAYAQAKLQARVGAGTVLDYNQNKQAVIRRIYAALFEFHGLA